MTDAELEAKKEKITHTFWWTVIAVCFVLVLTIKR